METNSIYIQCSKSKEWVWQSPVEVKGDPNTACSGEADTFSGILTAQCKDHDSVFLPIPFSYFSVLELCISSTVYDLYSHIAQLFRRGALGYTLIKSSCFELCFLTVA